MKTIIFSCIVSTLFVVQGCANKSSQMSPEEKIDMVLSLIPSHASKKMEDDIREYFTFKHQKAFAIDLETGKWGRSWAYRDIYTARANAMKSCPQKGVLLFINNRLQLKSIQSDPVYTNWREGQKKLAVQSEDAVDEALSLVPSLASESFKNALKNHFTRQKNKAFAVNPETGKWHRGWNYKDSLSETKLKVLEKCGEGCRLLLVNNDLQQNNFISDTPYRLADEKRGKAALKGLQHRYAAARDLNEQALAIYQEHLDSRHYKINQCWYDLSNNYMELGQFSKAEEACREVITFRQNKFGKEHKATATAWNKLGQIYWRWGKYPQAETAYQQALKIRTATLGEDATATATSWNNLGLVYDDLGKYKKAEQAHKKALDIRREKLGEHHSTTGQSWNNLGNAYIAQAKYTEAMNAYNTALDIRVKKLGDNHLETAFCWSNLGLLYWKLAEYNKAEEAHKHALQIRISHHGENHPDIAASWNGLGLAYDAMGKYHDAKQAYLKSLEIRKEVLGKKHPDTATSFNNLGALYSAQGIFSEAEKYHRQALAIRGKVFGQNHPYTALSKSNLSYVLMRQKKYFEAEKEQKIALDIRRKVLGENHPRTADSWNTYAHIKKGLGENIEAEKAYRKALDIRMKTLGKDHPYAAATRASLARTLLVSDEKDKLQDALENIRQANIILDTRFPEAPNSDSTENNRFRWVRRRHLSALSKAQMYNVISESTAVNESFITSQKIKNNDTGQAIQKMMTRLISSSQGALGDLIASYFLTTEQLIISDQKLIEAWQENNKKQAAHLRREIENLRQKLFNTNEQLAVDYPEYTELIDPKPVPVKNIQDILKKGEALMVLVQGTKESYLWVVRNDNEGWWKLPIGIKDVEEKVKTLRASMDFSSQNDLENFHSFPIKLAHQLYQDLIEPANGLLQGAEQIFVVTDGALQSIPLGTFVTELDDENSFREVQWLARKYAISYLPSVSSLKALRRINSKQKQSNPFIGFGDPVLHVSQNSIAEVNPQDGQEVSLANLRAAIGKLPNLPETADELYTLAKILNAPRGTVKLKDAASETNLKKLDLSSYDVITFATHGLMANELEYLGEPALVLSTPKNLTATDDGLLTASEITDLKLNADWVVLSACNTAASDGTPEAGGFSGLTKAFFYAGAKSLLVSHWPVESFATKDLTTGMFKLLKENPQIGKAEALRRVRLKLINDSKNEQYAHPAFWAPFVVVGEVQSNVFH